MRTMRTKTRTKVTMRQLSRATSIRLIIHPVTADQTIYSLLTDAVGSDGDVLEVTGRRWRRRRHGDVTR